MSSNDTNPMPTYEQAVLQVTAYKKIQGWANEVLRRFDINTSQWIILGQLYEHASKGLRSTDLARVLQVEIPLITNLIQALSDKKLVTRSVKSADKRVRILELTPEGETLVKELEVRLRSHLKNLSIDIKEQDLRTYFRVLEQFNAGPKKAAAS